MASSSPLLVWRGEGFGHGRSRKLGHLWVETALSAGAWVLALDRKGVPVSPSFSALAKKYKSRLILERGDVTSRRDLEKARDRALRKSSLAVIVNNAGIDQPPAVLKKNFTFSEIPIEDVRRMFEVNFLGAFQVLQVFGEGVARSGQGSVINIGSLYSAVSPDQRFYDHLTGQTPFMKPPAYGASKAALANLTKFLATLWGPKGVRVNTLSPGGVEGGQDGAFKSKFTARVPLSRMATLADLRGPFLFLASDASRYVTGINLMVDGGFTTW
ncbi:MAG: SDR family oxidoreductase [Elusimicrobia bacterium]|nr:SDR family oxidoreductase [Elusimicrobiota bacterium]